MDVNEAIRARRSVGRLEGEIEPETIRELIELAAWAPNHRLTEPWLFTVVAGSARERLGRLWGDLSAAASGLEGEARNEFARGQAQKLLRAPVLIVASTRTVDDPVVAEEDFAATAAAVQNLLLAASALGLGSMWRTGRMTKEPAVKAFLGLDPADRIVAVVYLGHPTTAPPPARPRNVERIIRWLSPES
jgi:nitroreductase